MKRIFKTDFPRPETTITSRDLRNGTSRLRADLQNSTNQIYDSRIILSHGSDEINKNKTP